MNAPLPTLPTSIAANPAPKSPTEIAKGDITALLKARNPLLWVVTREDDRAESSIVDAAALAGMSVRFWDAARGMTDLTGAVDRANPGPDPRAILSAIEARLAASETRNRPLSTEEKRESFLFVLRDFHKHLDPFTVAAVKSIASRLPNVAPFCAMLVLAPSAAEIPPELSIVSTVEFPIPDRAEIARILDGSLSGLERSARARNIAIDPPSDTLRDAAIDAAVGLTAREAQNCFARSFVSTGGKLDCAIISGEKKRVIAREKVLTWYDPDPRGLDAIGGLDAAKAWLTMRKRAFGPAARAYGLPAPKGLMLVGIPGTGKSLFAKCAATALGVPLLRLDLGALKSKYVGDSEANVRKALQVAEAVAPCVLWLDEIEKALAGSTGPQGDGGVSADALGAVLSWMQERKAPVFMLATANDVSALPPELLRKGRFDDIFFVDLPNAREREEILSATLRAHGRDPATVDVASIAAKCETFTGAEISEIVPSALFLSFDDGARAIATADLMIAARDVVPLARTAAEKIDALRAWAKGRARNASTPDDRTPASVRRGVAIDIG